MKASITKSGLLKIIPETELEEFAIMKWWEGFAWDGKVTPTKTATGIQACSMELGQEMAVGMKE